MTIAERIEKWQAHPSVDATLKQQLAAMGEEDKQDAFYKDIEFGTAGMRGVMGPGPNRINTFTIRKATLGFANYLSFRFADAKTRGVVIAHDNRHDSRRYNDEIASVFVRLGFKTFIFDELRPTPELSYAVRETHACGGIVITASHNPKQYNGFKVYDENGCQLTPGKIAPLIEKIEQLEDPLDIVIEGADEKGELITLGAETDRRYLDLIKDIQLHSELPKMNFKIVYSPQHGAAYRLGVQLLRECGYEVYPVPSQTYPDPDFKNTLSPNPELADAYIEPIKLAKKIGAHLIVITDPDADRVGIAYRDAKGNYVRLTGNQSGALLIDYLLKQRQIMGLLSDNGVVYDTIVTSPLGSKIAHYYGCRVESFLTGFKFIGDRIDFYEKTGGPHFEFGYEESYGCLIAPFARDKDGLQALLMYSEMALYHHLKGYNLGQILHIVQRRHGFHADSQYSIEFKGASGIAKMEQLMKKLRQVPFTNIGSYKVIRFDDYQQRVWKDERGEHPIELPSADVVKFYLNDGSYIAVRPSGTEPKCRFYYNVVAASESALTDKVEKMHQMFMKTYDISA